MPTLRTLTLTILLFVPLAHAETLLEQHAATNRFRFGAPTSLTFTKDNAALLYLRSGPRDAVRDLYQLDLETGEEQLLVTAERLLGGAEEELTAEELARRERQRDAGRGLSSFSLSPDGDTVLLPLSGRLFLLDRATGSVRELESDHASPIDARFSPDASMIAAVRDGDLYVADVESAKEHRLTTSEHERVSYAEAEFIAQEEMSRDKGYWWSPDSEKILYQRTDTRDVVTFRIMDPADPGKAPREWPYPRAGTNNAVVTLHLHYLPSGKVIDVEWDRETYPYLATVKWPKNAPLTLVVQNRPQTEAAILTVDPLTGETRTLHTERDDAWIDLDQSVPKWLNDGSAFFWSSERDGARTLELRDQNGSLLHAVTTPEQGYTQLLGVSEDEVFFKTRTNQIETHVARAPHHVPRGRGGNLTSGLGLFSAKFSDDANIHARQGQRPDGTRVSEIWNAEERIAVLPDYRERPNRKINAEFTTITGERDYRASIVRPADFDPTKKYPVLMRVYGGPTSVITRPTATALALDRWFADHGMIVVRFDGRGTPGRGSTWLREVNGDFISAPLDDLEDFVSAVCAAFPEMDSDRVGVFGWSWGGYYSAMAACRLPDTFTSAVIGAPVADWLDYDTHYTERYMGVPGEPGVDYGASSVLTYADQLEVPVLLIHGTADDNVYFTHSAKLADAWLRAGIPFEFLPLAGETHSVTDPAVAIPMYERIAEFFVRTLGAE